MDHDDDTTRTGEGDADLVLRARSGDRDAYAELWRRHYRSGITVARSITNSLDPDDLVQEAYARIYQSIRKGGGPTGSFRAYLFTSIRNTAAGWGRARHETTIDEIEALEDPASTEQATADALDRGLTHRAFRSLPTRWQEVLWYSEIEGMKPAEIAPLLGLRPTAVAQLAFRAREGLREAWIQAHLQSVTDGSDCQWTIERLGAYARGNLGRRDTRRVDEHLQDCARCAIVTSEAKDVSSRLALVLLPLTIGVAGASSYLATLQGAGAPLVALAAMPSAVTPGAGAGSAVGGTVVGGNVAGGNVVGGNVVGANVAGGNIAGGNIAGGSAVASTAAAGATTGGVFSGSAIAIAIAVGAVVTAGTVVGITAGPAFFAHAPESPARVDGVSEATAAKPSTPTTAEPRTRPSPAALPSTDASPAPVVATPAPNPRTVAPRVPSSPVNSAPPPAPQPTPSDEQTTPSEPAVPVDPEAPTEPAEPGGPGQPVDPDQPTLPPGGPTVFAITSGPSLQSLDFGLDIEIVGDEGATLSVDIGAVTRATLLLGPDAGHLHVPLNAIEYLLSPMTVRYVPTNGDPLEVAGSSPLAWDLAY